MEAAELSGESGFDWRGGEDAPRRVPDASYASNIAMQAWNIGRTLERSFIYAATRSWIVAEVGARASATASACITHRTRYESVNIVIVPHGIRVNRSAAPLRILSTENRLGAEEESHEAIEPRVGGRTKPIGRLENVSGCRFL